VLAVAAVISAHINVDSKKAWPSLDRIAKIVGTDKRQVRRAIHRLRELRLLEVEFGGGRSKTSSYRLIEWENRGDHNPGINAAINPGDSRPPERYRERHIIKKRIASIIPPGTLPEYKPGSLSSKEREDSDKERLRIIAALRERFRSWT
jgi:hypothetical protein